MGRAYCTARMVLAVAFLCSACSETRTAGGSRPTPADSFAPADAPEPGPDVAQAHDPGRQPGDGTGSIPDVPAAEDPGSAPDDGDPPGDPGSAPDEGGVPADAGKPPYDGDTPSDTGDVPAPPDPGPSDEGAEDESGALPAPPDEVDLGNGVSSSPVQLVAGGSVVIRYQGALSGKPNLWLHFGFNGWNEIPSLGQSSEVDDTNDTHYYQQAEMSPSPKGGFEITVSLPPEGRAIHFVFFSKSSDGSSAWDNNGEEDWGRGVPFPYAGPWLTWSSPKQPASGVVVNFQSGHPCKGSVEYGTTAALGLVQDEGASGTYHHVTLAGLLPDTLYHYRVGCPGQGPAKTHTFRTAKSVTDTFSFIVLGDVQDNGEHERWKNTVAALLSGHADAGLLVAVGDLAWNDKPGAWWTFFDHGRELLASKVMMPVAGNHDTPTTSTSSDTGSFEALFGLLPSGGATTFYDFAYGSAHFVALCSEKLDDFAAGGGKQYAWAKGVLAALSPKPAWVFAYWHIPPYNAGARHYDQQKLYRPLTELFDGVVDWHFAGHEHLYQRHKPLRYDAVLSVEGGYGNASSQGVGYLIVPPAGAWPEDDLIPEGDEKGYYRDRLAYPVPVKGSDIVPSEAGFVRADVAGATLTLTAYGMGTADAPVPPHVVDTISYTK